MAGECTGGDSRGSRAAGVVAGVDEDVPVEAAVEFVPGGSVGGEPWGARDASCCGIRSCRDIAVVVAAAVGVALDGPLVGQEELPPVVEMVQGLSEAERATMGPGQPSSLGPELCLA